jgi:hypothetical protein
MQIGAKKETQTDIMRFTETVDFNKLYTVGSQTSGAFSGLASSLALCLSGIIYTLF